MSHGGWRRRAYYRAFGADAALAELVGPGTIVLDVGCSTGTGSEVLDRHRPFGFDIHEPSLVAARAQGRRAPVVCGDILDLPFPDRAFDVVVALDVIEHLAPEDGRAFIDALRAVCGGALVLLTPSGFDPQPARPGQPWMEHRSGWTASELRALGFEVRGWGGPKALRVPGSEGRFRFGPVGAVLALLTRRWYVRRPDRSFHLLAIATC